VSRRAKISLALCTLLAGCLQQGDPAYLPVSLQGPYASWPNAPAGTAIEPGLPIKLDPRQQEAVVASVSKWMKNPPSASFGSIAAAKLREGRIAVCGEVDGRNSAGAYTGMSRFIGVLMGPEFVVVSIAQAGAARAEIDTLCQRSGIF
jgi:hypothetical protein